MDNQDEKLSTKIRNEYMSDVELLSKYMNWIEKKSGKQVQSYYDGEEDSYKLMQIPVYDSTLLAFVKDAGKTKLMDRNYRYVYTRYRIRSVEDELRLLKHAHLKDIDLFKGILSSYIMRGRSKGSVWSEGVQNGVFLELMRRMTALFFSTNMD
ncbi:MAG: hypothetical protein K6F34_01225 [Lachnospiraceae bacterium]|nr:hypothetical protein [Lachnospiraceae bacterium]